MGGAVASTDVVLAWPTAGLRFMDPEVAAHVLYAEEITREDGDRRNESSPNVPPSSALRPISPALPRV
jgi:acetyl-CoA carboxylase carboxyltransferase component